MGKSKVLVKVHPEGKYVVEIDKEIDIAALTPGGSKHSLPVVVYSTLASRKQKQATAAQGGSKRMPS
jgi:hypothetical protein